MVSGAKSESGSFLQRNLVVVLIVVMFTGVPLHWVSGTTTQLYPDHSDAVVKGAIGFGIVTGLAFSLLIAIVKPVSRSSNRVTAIAFFFCGLIAGILAGMTLVEQAFQLIDFSGPQVVRKVEDFAIARAYRTHGKSACSHIQLRDYFGDFCIDPGEYKTVFADSENTASDGNCLRVDTERNGAAIRIMHSSGWAFRPGAVVRCPNPTQQPA